jgi:hypothetical protein
VEVSSSPEGEFEAGSASPVAAFSCVTDGALEAVKEMVAAEVVELDTREVEGEAVAPRRKSPKRYADQKQTPANRHNPRRSLILRPR